MNKITHFIVDFFTPQGEPHAGIPIDASVESPSYIPTPLNHFINSGLDTNTIIQPQRTIWDNISEGLSWKALAATFVTGGLTGCGGVPNSIPYHPTPPEDVVPSSHDRQAPSPPLDLSTHVFLGGPLSLFLDGGTRADAVESGLRPYQEPHCVEERNVCTDFSNPQNWGQYSGNMNNYIQTIQFADGSHGVRIIQNHGVEQFVPSSSTTNIYALVEREGPTGSSYSSVLMVFDPNSRPVTLVPQSTENRNPPIIPFFGTTISNAIELANGHGQATHINLSCANNYLYVQFEDGFIQSFEILDRFSNQSSNPALLSPSQPITCHS